MLLFFAERIRFIRSEILNISQKEFAQQTKTHQPIFSRIELGKSSGATDVILNIINFLYSKGIDAKCLFDPLYDIHLLKPEISQLSIDEIIKIQMDAKADLTKALRKMELIEKYLEKINTSQ
ncbi:helix-turn-helix domain-containing protein [Arachidicoccus sp.]|jgi:predicted transcriptional regulator|uniref:helix-turn-helix domain-containing protein n=1 Tax=Arachidicoccus sp. TaxID=1872624 RepID=UPI003D251642